MQYNLLGLNNFIVTEQFSDCFISQQPFHCLFWKLNHIKYLSSFPIFDVQEIAYYLYYYTRNCSLSLQLLNTTLFSLQPCRNNCFQLYDLFPKFKCSYIHKHQLWSLNTNFYSLKVKQLSFVSFKDAQIFLPWSLGRLCRAVHFFTFFTCFIYFSVYSNVME